MKTIGLVISASLLLAGIAFAQDPEAASPEKAAVVANDRAYEAAYEKADGKSLAEFFAEDADYTTDDGHIFSGREAIEGAIKAGLLTNRGSKLAITADTVRVLGPDTVLEKGSTTVTSKDGSTSSALYTAIHIRKNGKWKISQLIESPVPDTTPHEQLSELAWLVGEWEETDKTNDITVHSEYRWANGGNYLSRNLTVKRAGEVTLEGWQIIGWDPVEENIRTWTFDGEGGYAEGRFTRDGDRWLLRETGYAPDGSRISSDDTITKLGADKYTWESSNRTLDGDPEPGIGRIEINRVKK